MIAARFVQIGALFLLVGVALGIVMHHGHNRMLLPLHAHVTVAGGVLTMLFGLVYRAWPAAGASRLAAWHFWLYLLSALALLAFTVLQAMRGPLFDDAGSHGAALFVAVAGLSYLGALLAFALNVWLHLRDRG